MVSKIRYYSPRRRKVMWQGEDIIPIEVYEAYGWTCHCCGRIIDRELRHPHPQSATVDHVVELSLGGQHVWENVRPAHKYCNEVRSRATIES